MKNNIIVGLGFGDEGKGLVTAALAGQAPGSTLVVRYGGGHQVGHTVMTGALKHKFSNFGSGTLNGATTYWSKYCTIEPIGIRNEYSDLHRFSIEPDLIIDPRAMVTMPFDILRNREKEEAAGHGSIGVGFGQTIQRNEDGYHLYAMDLLNPTVARFKIAAIKKYYNVEDDLDWFNTWLEAVEWLVDMRNSRRIKICDVDFRAYSRILFEGHQGTLLDMDYGFFPNVTRSYTTVRNAMDIIHDKKLHIATKGDTTQVTYVTRAYQTRHGAGVMTGESNAPVLRNTEEETNVQNKWQGAFRTAPIDFSLLQYALRANRQHYKGIVSERLIITCTDQMPPEWNFLMNDELHFSSNRFAGVFASKLGMLEKDITESSSPNSDALSAKIGW